jgi:secreted PhoX family phosphatase
VVRCWGDDWRLEYVYKFAAAAPSSVGARGEIRDTGTLYVAKFNADRSGAWRALAPGKNGPTPENGFAGLAEILINIRQDGGVIGA